MIWSLFLTLLAIGASLFAARIFVYRLSRLTLERRILWIITSVFLLVSYTVQIVWFILMNSTM
mgnify:CR=1 FL=1